MEARRLTISRRAAAKDSADGWAGWCARSPFLFGASGIVVLALQAIAWFQNGVWMDWTLLELWLALGISFSIPGASAVDRIWLQVLNLPAGPTLLAVGLALLIAARRLSR